jgi:uncharacterized RDD family membrane protein YckC
METFNLSTSQNVTLQFRIASVGDRILAFSLDVLILGSVGLIVALFISQTGVNSPWLLALLLPVLFYHFMFEVLFNGQSLGKMIMKVRVVKTDGSQLTIGSCFIRWIFRLVDVTLMGGAVAVLVIIINGKGQRWGDIAASTTVLKTSGRENLGNTIWTEVEENYQIRFPQVEGLSEKDIQVIQEVLLVSQKNGFNETSFTLLKQTRKAIAEKAGIVSELNDRDFLITLVMDFNAVHQFN